MENLFDKLIKQVANAALQFTPIISRKKPPGVSPVGCGIYLRVNDDRYLISAGHLMNLTDWPNLTVPAGGDKMVNLNGELMTTFEKPNSICDYDFAVFKFSERQNKHFTNDPFTFCNPEKILVNHKVDPKGYYVISGYPVTGVKKVSGEAAYNLIPIKIISAPMPEKSYKKHHIDSEHFILIKYQRKIAPTNSTERVITKKATGISGSGLWYIPDWKDLKGGIPKFYLVGIMIEDHKERRFMKAIRIDFVTQVVKDRYICKSFEKTNLNINEAADRLRISIIP